VQQSRDANQFTCFTGKKVQILTQLRRKSERDGVHDRVITCFTGTKVQILTQLRRKSERDGVYDRVMTLRQEALAKIEAVVPEDAPQKGSQGGGVGGWSEEAAVRSLLALLVQKYQY
jgi:hypothetical protein